MKAAVFFCVPAQLKGFRDHTRGIQKLIGPHAREFLTGGGFFSHHADRRAKMNHSAHLRGKVHTDNDISRKWQRLLMEAK